MKVSDSLPGSMNGTAIAYQKKNPRSYKLRRISYGTVILTKQYNHCTCMIPRRMIETCSLTTWCTNHHRAAASGDQRPYSLAKIIYEYDTEDEGQRSYQRETQDRFHDTHSHPFYQYQMYMDVGGRRTHFTNTKCIWTMEADENTCTSILEMSDSTHRCNPDSNSRKVSGWRIIITISDQANHLSAMKLIGIGTRLLILDRTAWTRQ